MTRAFLPAAAAALLVAAAASADVPLPGNLKYVSPRVAFEGVEKHPDYAFVLRYKTFAGNPVGVPYTTTPVKDEKPFTLPAQRRIADFKLLALPKADFDRRAKADPTLGWLTDTADGVQAAALAPPPTTAKADAKEVPVMRYGVTLKDGKLAVEQFGNGPAPDRKRGDAGQAPPWVAGLALAAAAVGLGLWLARRK